MLKKIDIWGCRLTVVVYILTMYKKGEWDEECFLCLVFAACFTEAANLLQLAVEYVALDEGVEGNHLLPRRHLARPKRDIRWPVTTLSIITITVFMKPWVAGVDDIASRPVKNMRIK